MTNRNLLFIIFFGLLQINCFSQDQSLAEKSEISKLMVNYFALDRENIHVQLNKSTYLNTEEIWLKGYIIEKKNHLPFAKTSNVYVSLLNDKGIAIKSNLYFAENSSFSGSYKLEESYASGTYYLQVYTNYMNNFVENESSVYKINIINPLQTNYEITEIIDYNSAKMEFFPESGVFLEGTSNVIGVQLMDCNKIGIEVSNAEVYNEKGTLITNFSTNSSGFGRFEILSTNNEKYKVVYTIKNQQKEEFMPLPVLKGISFSVNNYILPNKTSIKVKTNARTISESKETDYMFVFHKNDESSFLDVSFKDGKLEQSMIISNNQLSDGINAITLIDKNKNKIAERVLFQHSTFKSKLDLSIVKKTSDSISFAGLSNFPLSEVSITVLPEATNSGIFDKDIFNSLDFDANLKTGFKNASYYVNDVNRRKQLELDNILLCKEYKYDWSAILKTVNSEKYEFDSGLVIAGTINNTLTKKENFKVKMSSILQGINDVTEITDKNEFKFMNVVAVDSTTLHFSLLSKNEKFENLKLYTQLLKNNRKFIKSFQITASNCATPAQSNALKIEMFPKVAKGTVLDSIEIKRTITRVKLKNELKFNNSMAKGYKITDDIARSYYDLLTFIAANGFDVRYDGGIVSILGRASTSFNGTKTPQLFINDVPETNFNQLIGLNLNTIDEIYISKRGYGGGDGATNGVIRVYNRKGVSAFKSIEIKSKSLLVQNGFQPNKQFKNPKYSNYYDDGFKKFGTISFKQAILIDENGNFKFSVPNYYKEGLKILIEGISSEGQLISETRIIKI